MKLKLGPLDAEYHLQYMSLSSKHIRIDPFAPSLCVSMYDKKRSDQISVSSKHKKNVCHSVGAYLL